MRLCGRADDVDDIVQEAFLQAFMALDRLRDPDRFGAWLGGIIRNVHRAAGRQERFMLLAEWPEGLHPVSAQGLPSADDLDRAEALRAAVADLPDGQRRAVELYYYAGLPAGQIAGSPGAAKASLHKARRRLRAHITAHRPDLIPVTSRRTAMTTVRIACAEPHMDTRLDGSPAIGHILVVLADDPGHRAMGLWLRTRQGMALWRILDRLPRGGEEGQPPHDARAADLPAREYSPEDLAGKLLAAADGTATLSAAVPQPYGDVFLGQEWLADDYHGATVTLRAEVRSQDASGHAELSLDIVSQAEGRNQDGVIHAPPGDQPQPVQRVRRDRQHLSQAITGTRDWEASAALAMPVRTRNAGTRVRTLRTGSLAPRPALCHAAAARAAGCPMRSCVHGRTAVSPGRTGSAR